MKTLLTFLLLLMAGAVLVGESDPAAVKVLQRAAELHGLADAKALTSVEIDLVFSGVSGGVPGMSRWLSRLDFKRGIDLGVRSTYESYGRGAMYQRRIEGSGGYFMFGLGSKTKYDLGPYFGGNAVDGVSTVAILAVRGDLEDVQIGKQLTLGGVTVDQINFGYHGGKGTIFIGKDGRYAGKVEVNLKDDEKYYELVTDYQNYGQLVIPSRFSVFDPRKQFGGYGKLEGFRANPVFSDDELDTKVPAPDARGNTTPFGLSLIPADAPNFNGVKVADVSDPAKSKGIKSGDEIVSINGKDVRAVDYFTLEQMFWSEKSLTLGVLSGGKTSELKLSR